MEGEPSQDCFSQAWRATCAGAISTKPVDEIKLCESRQMRRSRKLCLEADGKELKGRQ